MRKRRKKGEHGKAEYFEAVIGVFRKGFGYAIWPETKIRYEIESHNLNTALDGDRVLFKILGRGRGNQASYAKVEKIITRSRETFVGTLVKAGNGYAVTPDDKRMYADIVVDKIPTGAVADKTKVLVQIKKWDIGSFPQGTIKEIIGKKGLNETEMLSIALDKGFSANFDAVVAAEARKIYQQSKEAIASEAKKRRDFRNTTTFTIDPGNAKDFDDALSLKILGGDKFEIGIHIADVSFFVRPNTAIDKEALKRGFSVYLVDRTIAMLPAELSDDLCSLNEKTDKLAFSAVFEMNGTGQIEKEWYGRTIIRSDKRFSYEAAQSAINNGGQFADELRTLNVISKKLRKERFDRGAVDFEGEEISFKLSADGKPISIFKKERLDTHKLVEEFMLLANRKVAAFLIKGLKQKGFAEGEALYRIHDKPDPEKIEDLVVFAKALGYDLESHEGQVTSKSLQKILSQTVGTSSEYIFKTAAIRSMAKAKYSTDNIGHYGLAFSVYTHFTSPIRRYPDLVVHRILESLLEGGKLDSFKKVIQIRAIALTMSMKEILAAEAERASIKFKQVEYMSERIGQVFDGTISAVTDWGIYIEERSTKCEGLMRFKDIGGDYYEKTKAGYSAIGRKSGKKYSVGDEVKFKVVAADLERRFLDYNVI